MATEEKPRVRVPAVSVPRTTIYAPQRARASFEGGSNGARTLGWGDVGAFNAAMMSSGPNLRSRSHKAYRNFGLARRGIDRLVDAVIGTGASLRLPKIAARDPAFARLVLDLWREWERVSDPDGITDFRGQQRTVYLEMLLGGDCFLRIRPRRPTDPLPVPMQVEILAADYLPDHHYSVFNGNPIKSGIEFDLIGRRVAYWMYRVNPRDYAAGWQAGPGAELVRLPADLVMHVREPGAAGDLRGTPRLAPVLQKMRDLDDYDDAELLRKRNAAAIAGFVRRAVIGEGSNVEQGADDAGRGSGALYLQPGTFLPLDPGEDITLAGTTDLGGQYEAFLRAQVSFIAAGLGIPYEALSGDWSRVNDRSYRAAMLEWKRSVEATQWLALVPQFLTPTFRAWALLAVESGRLVLPSDITLDDLLGAADWSWPAWGWLHPVQEIQGYALAVEKQFRSRSSVIAELGYDAEEVMGEIAAENARAREIGIALPARDAAPSVPTGATPGGTDEPADQAPQAAAHIRPQGGP
jgi:lambda family phage portal protein